MTAYITTTISRRRRNARRRRALALALGICALAIPATASAAPVGDQGYSSVNSISPPASEPSSPSGSADVDSGYSSLNAISGSPADAPTFVSGSPSGTGDGFDWPSAVVGAGAAMALAALAGAALLTVRRRTAISPSASTS
jgi:hypothetical protein